MLAALYILGLVLTVWFDGLATAPAGELALPAVWMPAGVLLGTALVSNLRKVVVWGPLALVALAVSSVMQDLPLLPAAVLAAIATATAIGAAYLVHHRIGRRFYLGRFNDALTFVIASLAAAVAAAVLSIPVAGVAGARGVFLADATGLLMTAPVAAGLISERRWWRDAFRSGWRVIEVVVVIGAAVATTEAVFGERIAPFLRVPAFILPFMLWPSFRFGPSASALGVFLICADALQNVSELRGPYMSDLSTVDEALLRGQGSIVMLTISFTILASIVAERREALEEVRTLRGLIPICAWCHKVRDEAEVWQRLETYLDANTDATFSHSICPSCAATKHAAGDQAGSSHPWKI